MPTFVTASGLSRKGMFGCGTYEARSIHFIVSCAVLAVPPASQRFAGYLRGDLPDDSRYNDKSDGPKGCAGRVMFGARTGHTISSVSLWSLFLLAIFVWPGLLMWAIIVFFIAGIGASPLEDVTPLTPWRRRLGYVTFAILIGILLPLPHALWQAAGIHCPYL
jgi:hypothetical protein